MTNHLGNVLVTISDKRFGVTPDSVARYFIPDVVSANDYYPFGSLEPGRSYAQSGTGYRYGFNGKEKDDEVKGAGDQIDYGMRVYDPRVGRFLSVDPLRSKYPWYTPYQFAGNIPIAMNDRDGLEEVSASISYNPNYGTGSTSYPKLKPSEWTESDRNSGSGTFVSAARYNTNTLNSSVYKPVAQIHAYYVWAADEMDKTKSNIKFFAAARDVTGFFAVGGAYVLPGLAGLSEHGRQSLGDVNAKLLKENLPVVKDLINKGKSDVVQGTGIIWDFNYVHREQNFLTEVITKDPLSRSDEIALNGTFSNFEIIHPEYGLAKALVGASSINYNISEGYTRTKTIEKQ